MNKLIISGIFLVWLIVVLFLLYSFTHPTSIEGWASFIAGITSPLALVFLALGYYQQGKDSENNTSQLKRQIDILEAQHEMQKEMDRNQKGPDLHFSKAIINEEECITITNKGAIAININIAYYHVPLLNVNDNQTIKIADIISEYLKLFDSTFFELNGVNPDNPEFKFNPEKFDVNYEDLNKRKYSVTVSIRDSMTSMNYIKMI